MAIRLLGRALRVTATVTVLVAAAGLVRAAGPPMRLSKMTFVALAESVTEIRVEADSGVIDEAANKADLRTVHAEWAGADGKLSLELSCERGELDLETNDLVASGNVRGLLADGRRFAGPSLRYDRARGVAFTDAPVEIIEEGRILSGGGFQYHVRDRRLRLTAGARVEENRKP
ncbi:MAG: Lipopolysaccharide-assembly, LptC-related [Deltaproteobacteria bacterium]|nr:Lipopolysaccharide-assembly, LptC-related [Deltaproteobacteria bacterium]